MKYRKKPVVIDAVQWTGANVDEVAGFMLTKASLRRRDCVGPSGGLMPGGALLIETIEGTMTAQPNDWIIKGVQGEFYLCKPDIFEATYEAA
jgi:hypothetical protein